MTQHFAISDVLAWARTKPANERYDFCKAGVCALGQYAQEIAGFSSADAACEHYAPLVSEDLRDAALGRYIRWPNMREQTFGAFVKRLETLSSTATYWVRIDAYLTDIEQVQA